MPDNLAQLREWLQSIGLGDADVLAIFSNDDLAELDREQLPMLHGLLEARWSTTRTNWPLELGDTSGCRGVLWTARECRMVGLPFSVEGTRR